MARNPACAAALILSTNGAGRMVLVFRQGKKGMAILFAYFTTSSFLTPRTPCIVCATCSARARSALDFTEPVSVTTPFTVCGSMSCVLAAVRADINAARTRLFSTTSGVSARLFAWGTSNWLRRGVGGRVPSGRGGWWLIISPGPGCPWDRETVFAPAFAAFAPGFASFFFAFTAGAWLCSAARAVPAASGREPRSHREGEEEAREAGRESGKG